MSKCCKFYENRSDNKVVGTNGLTQTPEKNPQHDHDILQLCSGKVTNLCTFALWQQLSTVLVNRHFF